MNPYKNYKRTIFSWSLYDFANQGKMILIELCGAWAKPCSDFSSWLSSNDQTIKEYRWWKDRYLPIRDMIVSGEIILIHIMSQGPEGNKSIATPKDVTEWYNKYGITGAESPAVKKRKDKMLFDIIRVVLPNYF